MACFRKVLEIDNMESYNISKQFQLSKKIDKKKGRNPTNVFANPLVFSSTFETPKSPILTLSAESRNIFIVYSK